MSTCEASSFMIKVVITAIAAVVIGWCVLKIMNIAVTQELITTLAITGATIYMVARFTGLITPVNHHNSCNK